MPETEVQSPQTGASSLPQKPAKPKLKAIPSDYRPPLTRAVRTQKMVRPECTDCQNAKGAGWWQSCTHDPYFLKRTNTTEIPTLRTNDEGETIVEKYETKIVYTRVPNIVQVGSEEKVNGGMGVQRALAHGFKWPEEVDPGDGEHTGFARMCEFNGCYQPNPKIEVTLPATETMAAEIARFCSKDHARMILMRRRGIPMEVMDRTKFREQLDSIFVPDAR